MPEDPKTQSQDPKATEDPKTDPKATEDPKGQGADPKATEDPKTDPAPANDPKGESFTQADVDRIVQDRLARERKTHEAAVKEAERRAKLDEKERAEAERDDARKELEEMKATAKAAERRSALVSAAVAASVRPDRLDVVERLADPEQEDAGKAVKAVVDRMPELVAPPAPGGSGGDFRQGGGEVTKEEFQRMTYPERADVFTRDPALYARLAGIESSS